jgi:hypothetical protein
MRDRVDAFVVGRLSSLCPLQINAPVEEVWTLERFVGGWPATS